MDLVEVLSFLFMLSTMELGRVCPCFSLSFPLRGIDLLRNTPSSISAQLKPQCLKISEITASSGSAK